ncbi:MAG: beta-glucosidase, partial [Ginsengibacter sp.]
MIKFSFLLLFLGLTHISNGQQKREISSDLLIQKNLSDSALLDVVQRQTIKYFWDFAHPVSGMARERSNRTFDYGEEVVTTGGTGFGVMALIVGVERKWL